jgi:hypothetical protein
VVETFRAWFWLVVPTWAEPWRGFLRGLSFLVIECGYPLFRYLTPRFSPEVHVLAGTLVSVVSTNTMWFGG